MSYSHNLLISPETGEYDWTYIKRQAVLRAQQEYGGSEPPVSYVRDAMRHYQGTAEIMRRRWRRAHGLPDDTPMTTVTAYGNIGEGVRRSAF